MIKVEWRSVKDGLPVGDETCLIAIWRGWRTKRPGYDIIIAWYHHDLPGYWHGMEWMGIETDNYYVTHWTPFKVEPPEEPPSA